MVKGLKKTGCILLIMLILMFINIACTYAITPISEPSYQGIDVSNWQGYIDYNQVAASGIKVVYMKASQGTTYKDPYFDINYENAKRARFKSRILALFNSNNSCTSSRTSTVFRVSNIW